MAESSMFKPATSASGMGKKKMDDGQFANPPAYPEVSGFSGPEATRSSDNSIMGKLEKSPSARRGKV